MGYYGRRYTQARRTRQSNPELVARIEKIAARGVSTLTDWERKTWNENYTPEMREKAIFAASYYKANPPYFDQVAERIMTDEKFIPSEKLYRKMVENKYVQRAMQNSTAAPKFAVGSMAMVRDSANVQGRLCAYRGKLVMIIEVEEDVRSATKGARKMTVLPVGGTEMVAAEERYLKTAKV
jgi:hypothetical protein